MRALTVRPDEPDSLQLDEVAEPVCSADELLVEGLEVGLCGTDYDIVAGEHGQAALDSDRLVIGHESLGRVIRAPANDEFGTGDLVAGVVRRPDPVPCGACAEGEFDMCRNGRYTERGIKQRDGYACQQWTVDPRYAVRLDPDLADVGVLTEPASIVAKAWEQIELVGARSWFRPQQVLVTGAGPIGLLAALLARQRDLDVHVLDQVTDGPKPDLVTDLGATYHHRGIEEVATKIEPDIVVEATGAARPMLEAMTVTGTYGVVCLTGLSSPGRRLRADIGEINLEVVLENDAVVGSVSSRTEHFTEAVHALAQADREWLRGLISRRVPVARYAEAFDEDQEYDVKVVLTLTGDS